MMKRVTKAAIGAAACCVALSAWGAEGTFVNESARDVPIAHEVDVAIVGGGTGAVAAAIEAAEAGASVFLAAPYPYLGDDMTATLRLWLEEGEIPEHPLAQRVFDDDETRARADGLAFSYETDIPSAEPHLDTDPPSRLTNGEWGNAQDESVQYNGDVTLTAELDDAEEIDEARVVVYRREESTSGGSGFNVERMGVSISDDGETWTQTADLDGQPGAGTDHYTLTAPIDAEARYVRFEMTKPEDYERILLGEIELLGADADPAPIAMPRPMHVKKTLDEALLEADVEYLYSCMVTDVLRDAQGEPAGIVVSNRAGRQAVVAKTIIDATSRAQAARLAGAEFREYPAGTHTFRRTVIGGEPQEAEGMEARIVEPPFRRGGDRFDVIEYTLELPMDDASHASWMEAEQQARTMTYHPDQEWASDVLFQVPPDSVRAQEPAEGAWPGAEETPLGALRPEGVRGMYVLGGCADVPREYAGELVRPLALIDLGARVGTAAAQEAGAVEGREGVHLPGDEAEAPAAAGDVCEALYGPRPVDSSQLPGVAQDARSVPVLGEYDVVIIGGGTSGAPAGIGAARQGANVLVVEYLHGLGGVGTEGAIARDWYGNRVGFADTVLDGASNWRVEVKKEWWRSELLDAGADIWFGSLGAGAFVDGERVRGAVVVTPMQRGVVLADVVIDATGNSDVAAAAGAETDFTNASKVAVQGAGLPGRELSGSYNNTDFNITDESDIVDIWHMFVHSKYKYPDAFDHGRLIDTRERRRIMGDARLTLRDSVMRRTYPDTVVQAYTNFDSHGYAIDPYILLAIPERGDYFYTNIPYRAMLPRGLEGMLVVGLGISAHRDAVPLIRMQPDIENGGYAAGVAASMAGDSGVGPRDIDVQALQQHLVDMGNLPEEVLEHEDSYPMPPERIAEAVQAIPEEGDIEGAAIVLAHAEEALPMVKEAYEAAQGGAKVTYAKVLAVVGDASGLDTMLEELQAATEWDDGWNYRGMGQFGRCQSELDELIIAIGKTREERAVPALLEKVETLSAEEDFSHHRAVARALELIGDERAAEPLAGLLAKSGMTGNHHPDIETAIEREANQPGGTTAVTTRRESLRELLLARALYRCGDHEDVGREILEDYTTDLRGHLARHAKALLAEK